MDELLEHLREREVALHQAGVRADVNRLEELLHESFAEIGRSGRSYSRADILEELPLENTSSSVLSQDFCVAEITNGMHFSLTNQPTSIQREQFPAMP